MSVALSTHLEGVVVNGIVSTSLLDDGSSQHVICTHSFSNVLTSLLFISHNIIYKVVQDFHYLHVVCISTAVHDIIYISPLFVTAPTHEIIASHET